MEELSFMGYNEEMRKAAIEVAKEDEMARILAEVKAEARTTKVKDYVETVKGLLGKGFTLDEAIELVPKDIVADVRLMMSRSCPEGSRL